MIFRKKGYGGAISVKENSNVVYSVGLNSWQTIRPGSLLQVEKDTNFYKIARVETENVETSFEKANNKFLVKNVLDQLSENDAVHIYAKQYQVGSITSISSNGKGYKEEDELAMEGGSPILDVSSNLYEKARFKIIEVDENGGIRKIKPIYKGKYLSPKNSISFKLTGGSGFDAELTLDFEIIGSGIEIERIIKSIERSATFSFITLKDSLPENITNGFIKFSKSKMILETNYLGRSVSSAGYSIIKDFTPIYGFPLMAEDSLVPEFVYNEAMLKMDAKIAELEKKIQNLRS